MFFTAVAVSLSCVLPSLSRSTHTLSLATLAHAHVLALILALALSICARVCMTPLKHTQIVSCTISLSEALCLARSLSLACVVSVAQIQEAVHMCARWGI